MATIVTRSGKGSPLTNNEVDANFTNLNTELGTKVDSSSLSAYQPLDGDLTSIAGLTGTTGLLRKTAANTFSLDASEYLTSFTEADPTVPSHVKAITTTNIANWDAAFGWGNHASAGYLTGITSGQVTTALGFTPYDATNPSGYITTAGARSAISATGSLSYNSTTGVISFTEAVTSVAGKTGAVTLTNADVGLGNVENKSSATIRGELTSGNVTTALGFTPYNATNPAGYITSSASITGSAASITGFNNPTTAPTANTIVYRDASGDISAREIVLSSGLSSATPTVLVSMYPTTNQMVRTTPAAVSAAIQGVASGSWGISVTGNAATATALQNSRAINGTGFNGTADISVTEWLHSDRDFASGTLISTSIDYGDAGDPFVLEIDGNSYGSQMPFSIKLQGYIYSGTIINIGAYAVGPTFSIIAMNVSGKLCFWFARQGYWQGFNAKCYSAYAGRAVNKVTSITSTANPNGTKQVTFNPVQVLRSDNYTSYAMPSGSSATNSVDVRAPIFYDSDNTGYYVDPNGRSNLSNITVASGGTESGIRFRGDTLDFVGRYSNYVSLYNANGPEFKLFDSGYAYLNVYGENAASWRAPIFYDSNNTAYYVDPAGSSLVNQIYYAGLYNSADGNYGVVAANGYFDTVNSGYASDPLELCYVKGTEVRVGTGGGNLPIKASAYYKGTDTAYFVDPTGTSNLVGLTVANRITGSVTGCTFTQDSQDQDNIANRTDSGFYQSSSGTAAEGWPINDSSWQHMIACTHTNDGNYFAMQLGASFFSQGLFYRSVANSGTQAWSRVALYDNGYAAPLYASIYYDADNTGFYIDPSSSSYLNTVSMGAQTWRGDITWNNAVNILVPASAECSFDVATSGVWQVWDSTTGAPMIKAPAGSNVQIGEAGSRGLYVYGGITASGNVTAYSDIRIKANVETIPDALDKLDLIRGVTYTRTDLDDKEQRYAGVIAQEIEAVLPEAVRDMGNVKAVDYNATIGLLIQAVKELRDEVERLKK